MIIFGIVLLMASAVLHNSSVDNISSPLGHLMSADPRNTSQYVVLPDQSQAGSVSWQRCLGGSERDCAHSVRQTSDGGYIVAGESGSNDGDVSGRHGGSDAWIVKLDADGALSWQRCLGGSSRDQAESIQQTSDGGYIFAGYTWSNDGDVSGSHSPINYPDAWVVKLDADGKLVWQRCLGGTLDDFAYSIQQTSDGGYIVAGYTMSSKGDVSDKHGGYDVWVVKLDTDGMIAWQKCLGGVSNDLAYSIQQTSDGGYIIAGYTGSKSTASDDGDVSGSHGGDDAWVVKLDTDGALIWQRCIGGVSGDYAECVQQTADNGYIVAGRTHASHGNISSFDFWVVKLDAKGTITWQKSFGGSEQDAAYDVQQTLDGGYIVAGYTQSNDDDASGSYVIASEHDAWVVRLDANGTIIWQRSLGEKAGKFTESYVCQGSEDHAESIQQTSDGGYIVGGFTLVNGFADNSESSNNHGGYDAWVVKLVPD